MNLYVKRTNHKDCDSINILITVDKNDKHLVIDGSYNIRTNMAHVFETDEQRKILSEIGIDVDDIVFKIEERKVELN